MFRFLFRLAAAAAFSIAVLMAVADATRSLAASELVLTPLLGSWQAVAPGWLEAFRAFVTINLGPAIWRILETVMILPGFVIFAALAVLFYAIGRRPAPRIGRFAVDA